MCRSNTGPILTFTASGHLPEFSRIVGEFPLNFLLQYKAKFPILEFTYQLVHMALVSHTWISFDISEPVKSVGNFNSP